MESVIKYNIDNVLNQVCTASRNLAKYSDGVLRSNNNELLWRNNTGCCMVMTRNSSDAAHLDITDYKGDTYRVGEQ